MLDGSRSGAECALDEVPAAEEVEALPDVHAAFPGLSHAGADQIDRLDKAGAFRAVAAREAEIARVQATQLRALARLGRLRDNTRSSTAEVALATATTESRARDQLALAETMTTRLPHTLAAMDAGQLDAYKAGKIADATGVVDDATTRQADTTLAGRLAGKNPTALRQAASRVVARLDPDGAERRAATRRHERRVDLIHQSDGIATLTADLPAELAGHGPLPAATARAIAHQPNATWRRIRDRTCRHPGCHRPTHHGDLDHHTAWSHHAGPTSTPDPPPF